MKKSGFAKGVFWTLSIGIILVVVLIVGALMWYSYAPPFEASYSSDGKRREAKIKIEKKDKVDLNKEQIQPKINKVSVADENNFEAIIKNLSNGESLSYDLSNKNDKEKITATIKKYESKFKTVNEEDLVYIVTSYNYEVLDEYKNKISYTTTTNDKYPKYKTYNYVNRDTFYIYGENVDKNFKNYKTFGNSNFFLIFSNQLYENNDFYIGLNKSLAEIRSNLLLETLEKKVDNKVLTEDEATKIVIDKVISHINYVNFIDNTLIYSMPLEEKKKLPSFPITGKSSENAILYYERENKKNVENSDFIGLCNNQEKFNNFYINNYEKKNCKELLYSLIEDKFKTDFVSKSKGLEEKLISYLSTPIEEKLKTNEKYYALVIGNNKYEHLEKLDAAENDAEVIADVLTKKYGFEVDLLLNADYDTTVNSLFKITNKLKRNDNLLIYYAGHGELDKAENRGYWLPVDASFELRSKWISNQRIVDRIKATKAKHVLLIADSCFSGSLMRSGTTPDVNEAIDEKYIERLKSKKTRLVITSGGNEPVVDSDGGNHSLFALKLIDTLKNNNTVINSQILFENIRRYVVSNADQTPERALVHKTGHDGGDFLFFPKK